MILCDSMSNITTAFSYEHSHKNDDGKNSKIKEVTWVSSTAFKILCTEIILK